jgi:OOP family OmpA-OmpF porin
MNSARTPVVLVVVVVVALATTLSCVGPGVQKQADAVRVDIEKARKSGAYQCAPRELALAETSVDFAENELAQGDFLRARQHIELAVTNANAALANSKECAPKRVLIKTKTDKDGDGILDDVDQCPDQPEDKDLFEDEDGCPDPDNDQDTVLDPLDKCPNTKGPVENEGCPYGDKDGDGINDKEDACPDAPEDKDGDRDTDGRPDVDVDGDGVEDCTEGCPLLPTKDSAGKTVPAPICDTCTVGTPELTKEDKDNFEDTDGCPDVDNDKDGLLDTVDKCPNDPGPPSTNGCPDKDGDGFADIVDACPDVVGVSWANNPEWKEKNPKGGDGCPPVLTLIVIKKDKIEIKQQVQFDTAKATIKPVSAKLLAEVGTAIRSSPDIKKVTIEGHTDDVGDDDYNMNLSQERANSVRQWLIDKEKVDPNVLEATGFGETKPIASNRTKAGRQQNRRSEFKVERKD